MLVGGPDVDARIELMKSLEADFDLRAVGTADSLKANFARAGFEYDTYSLSRGVNPFTDILAVIALIRLFRQRRPELVHTFDTKPSVFGRIAARLAGVPVVIGTLPGLGSLYVDEKVPISTRVIRAIYELLQRISCALSDLTLFQNQQDIQQFTAKGIVSAAKSRVIPGSGVRTDVFDPDKIDVSERERVRSELGIAPGALAVTMISRLIRTKGVMEFVAAAEIVSKSHPEVTFLLVGPADSDSVDRLTPEELDRLKQTVRWPGARKDIPVILAASDIFVLPSFYREGIPRVLLEAASIGLPIVTTDSPGCNDVVENDANGFLVSIRNPTAIADAVTHLVEQPELRARFGRESRRRAVELFDLAKIAAQTRSVYQSMLKGQRGGDRPPE
jgi:glycosyltransferase involved in cell wall biosynthesis